MQKMVNQLGTSSDTEQLRQQLYAFCYHIVFISFLTYSNFVSLFKGITHNITQINYLKIQIIILKKLIIFNNLTIHLIR